MLGFSLCANVGTLFSETLMSMIICASEEWIAIIKEEKLRTWMLEVGWDLPEGDPMYILINEEENEDE